MKELTTIARNPAQSERVQAFVEIIAELEHRQLEAVEQLHEATGIDGIDRRRTVEERREQLLRLADAFASGDLVGFWFEEVASDHLENAEAARAYAGMEDDAWADQIETWAGAYRKEGVSEERSDRDIAREHVHRNFGISLAEFEREVINFDRGAALETLLAANFDAVEKGIYAAAEEIEAE